MPLRAVFPFVLAAAVLSLSGCASMWPWGSKGGGSPEAPPPGVQDTDRELQLESPAGNREVADGIAATVNGRVITKSEVREAVATRRFLIAREEKNPAERRRKMETAEKEGLEDLINRELILSEFDKKGGQLKPQYVDEEINRFIRENYNGDRKAFLKELREARITLRKFRETREKMLVVQSMQSAAVRDAQPPSPGEIRAFYEKNIDDYREEGQVRLRTISIPKKPFDDPLATEASQRRLADEIRAKIASGSPFDEMARQYSKDSAAKEGGDRGFIDRTTLRPDLTAVAFSMETKEVSTVLEDGRNYWILYVEERRYGRTAPLEEVREQIERRVQQEKQKELVDAWLERLRRRAVIRYY